MAGRYGDLLMSSSKHGKQTGGVVKVEVSYVLAVQEKMATMAELVKNNLVKSQREQKRWYDQAGGQVLVLLLAQWQGLYPVLRE